MLFLPFFFFTIPGVLMPTTRLYTLPQLWQHIGEFNVWWRLLSMLTTMVMFYAFLLRLPFNWRYSSADRRWVRRYALLMTPIGICFYVISFVFLIPVHIVHILWIAMFICYYTYYELFLRLIPTKESNQQEVEEATPSLPPVLTEEDSDSQGSNKYSRIFWQMDYQIDYDKLFCDPDFGRDQLCQLAHCNHTEIGRMIKENTDATNSKVYINRKRVTYAAHLLLQYPNYSIEAIAFDAGFRTKVTFHRLFKDTYGITPAEYREEKINEKSYGINQEL